MALNREHLMRAAQAFPRESGIKRFVDLLKPSVNPMVSATSLTINSDDNDLVKVTALAANLTINAPLGTPSDGQRLSIWIKDNGVSRTLTWNPIFRGGTVTLPVSTTFNQWRKVNFRFNATDTKWDAESSVENF